MLSNLTMDCDTNESQHPKGCKEKPKVAPKPAFRSIRPVPNTKLNGMGVDQQETSSDSHTQPQNQQQNAETSLKEAHHVDTHETVSSETCNTSSEQKGIVEVDAGKVSKVKPTPKPRVSLLKKEIVKDRDMPADDMISAHRNMHQTSTESKCSLTRTLSYQSAVDGFLADLIAEEDNTTVDQVNDGNNVFGDESKDASDLVTVETVVSSDVKKGTTSESCQLRRPPPPPLPAKAPIGQPVMETVDCPGHSNLAGPGQGDLAAGAKLSINVNRSKSPSPPKRPPKPSKQLIEQMQSNQSRRPLAKLPASISSPNISQHQVLSPCEPNLKSNWSEHHRSCTDIKGSRPFNVLSHIISKQGPEVKAEEQKLQKKEKRQSSQFYVSLDGVEQDPAERGGTHWWSFGKGTKKGAVKKTRHKSSSTFYCGVNEGGTLRFENTKQVGEGNKTKEEPTPRTESQPEVTVIENHDGSCTSENDYEEISAFEKKYLNQKQEVEDSIIRNSDEDIPALPQKMRKQCDRVPVAPPRTKRNIHLLEKESVNQCDSNQKVKNKQETPFKMCDMDLNGEHVMVSDVIKPDRNNLSKVVNATDHPENILDNRELDNTNISDDDKKSNDVESYLSDQESDNICKSDELNLGEGQEVASEVLDSEQPSDKIIPEFDRHIHQQQEADSESSSEANESVPSCKDDVYISMSASLAGDMLRKINLVQRQSSHRCSGSSKSSDDEYVIMNLQTSNTLEVERPAGVHAKRPSSWAGPESDESYISDNNEDLNAAPFNTSQTISSDDTDDSETEANLADVVQTLVDMKEKLNKRKFKCFCAAKEIMTSEESFVQVLRLLNEDFRQHVLSAKGPLGGPVIPMKEVNQILKYLPLLQNFSEELLKDLKLRIDNWENCKKIADVFIQKGPFLKMYTDYIREFESICSCLEEARKRYPEFDKAVAQFEASPKCSHMAIKHFLLKPIQRIPQYRLLLQEYRKYLDEDSEDYQDADRALVIVSEVAEHANQSMALENNLKKLIEIQNSLTGEFEVIKPGRLLVKSGILQKLCRKEMQPRMFFLFNDTLLCTTPVASGFKFKTEMLLDSLKVSKPNKEDFANEFSIISTTRSFRLSASTPIERDEWLKTLQDTITEYRQKRYSYMLQSNKHPTKTADNKSLFLQETDFELGKQAPVWTPDSRVSMCARCHEQFTVTFRRHHCRACGKVFCGPCCDNQAPLFYQNYKPGRVCIDCFNHLKAEVNTWLRCVEEYGHNRQVQYAVRQVARGFMRSSYQGPDTLWGSFGKGKRKRSSVLVEVQAATDDADNSGYMEIWENKHWKRMWFVLKDKVLYFYKASEDTAAVKSTVLVGFEVQIYAEPFQKVDSNLVFQVLHKNVAPLIFKTDSKTTRDRWVKYMKQAVIP